MLPRNKLNAERQEHSFYMNEQQLKTLPHKFFSENKSKCHWQNLIPLNMERRVLQHSEEKDKGENDLDDRRMDTYFVVHKLPLPK